MGLRPVRAALALSSRACTSSAGRSIRARLAAATSFVFAEATDRSATPGVVNESTQARTARATVERPAKAGRYFSVNRISMWTRTATAMPSFVPGLNVHCVAAFTA